MAIKNRQDLNNTTDDVLADFLFERLSTEILIDILKHKIATGQADIADLIQELAGDKEAAVIILKR